MESSQIVDIWNTFKDSLDKKHIETVAEKYVDVCADFGADDTEMRDAMGSCDFLDAAITYYLDIGDEESEYDRDPEDDWED
ncbi:MAG: hypothetical protein CMA64_05300 [Euryarchaeota archaeon]|nr:hypothetical protein [Euryarchaeota archaeon]|tara:strand:- start:276 stop:518 length:243 start_codon:yes stop_codon:yes gene_type:complete